MYSVPASDQFRYEQLSRLHELYNGKVGVPKHVPNNFNHSSTLPTRMQSASLSDVFKNGTTESPSMNHDFTHPSNDFDNNSIASEPAYLLVSIYCLYIAHHVYRLIKYLTYLRRSH